MTLIPFLKSSKIFIFVCSILICILFLYLNSSQKKSTASPLPRVTTTMVKAQLVTEKITLPGTLVAPIVVKLHPRVDGQIVHAHFQNGDIVQKNQLLFTLDDTLLQAQLAQAEGSLARDQANFQHAESEVKRNQSLIAKEYTSVSKFDQTVTNAQANRGALQNSQALVDQFKTQLSYTKIYSPIHGQIGYVNISEGNYARVADAESLVTIVQLDPIEVRFPVPEKYLSQLQNMNLTQTTVHLLDLNKHSYDVVGYLKTLDNQVDTQSGTILVAATFDNSNYKLRPGQYMTVEFSLSSPVSSLVLPVEAVQIGQESSYVYLYHTHDQTVHYRAVETQTIDDKIVAIKKGLSVDDVVVASGQLKLKDKIKVKVVTDTAQEPVKSSTSHKVT